MGFGDLGGDGREVTRRRSRSFAGRFGRGSGIHGEIQARERVDLRYMGVYSILFVYGRRKIDGRRGWKRKAARQNENEGMGDRAERAVRLSGGFDRAGWVRWV